ncbi:MAG: hypothetical protein ACRDE7_04380, partial [Sphingobacterium sp.]
MKQPNKQYYPGFSMFEKQNGIVEFIMHSEPDDPVAFDLDYFTFVLQKLVEQQMRLEITGIIMHFSGVFREIN